MTVENTFDNNKLILELKGLHKALVEVYRKAFDFKYKSDEEFKLFIDKEHKENGIGSEDKKVWNDNFCHRASYTLLNKILFVRICEDKGFMLNPEDYIAGQPKDPHMGEKLSKIGLQKWSNLVTNHTLGELVKFAFKDMKESYNNIILYKEDKYEILNPRDEEFSLKYVAGDEHTKELVIEFESVLNSIIEKLDTNNFDFKYTDGNILGDVYEKFMDRETRKAIGQFYTPEFVIEYILKNTVEEADVLENPFVTVADISCGSGHFLIMAYDILKYKFLSNIERLREKYSNEVYTIKINGKKEQLIGEEYWRKEHVHYHILKHCIYGADIDSFAVQLTTINLILKDLDNFTDELNIIECDSLIKWEEDYDWHDLREQLDEDYVVKKYISEDIFGNKEEIDKREKRTEFILKNKNNLIKDKEINKEEAIDLIKLYEFWNRKFDYIVGNPPWISLTGKHRNKIPERLQMYYINTYKGNTYMPNMYEYFIRRGLKLVNKGGKFSFIIPDRLGNNDQFIDLRNHILTQYTLEKVIYDIDFPDVIADTMIFALSEKYSKNYNIDIGSMEYTERVAKEEILKSEKYVYKGYDSNSVKNLINKIQENKEKLINIGDTTSGFGGKSSFITTSKENNNQIKILKGENIEEYAVRSNYYFEFKKENITGRTTDINKLGYKYKILLRKTGDKLIATYDDSKYYPEQSLYFIYNLNKNFDYHYILAIINSKLMNYYYLNELVTNLNSTPQLKKGDLDRIPIPKTEEDNQNIIISLAHQITKIKKEILNWDFRLSAGTKNEILDSYDSYLYKVIDYYELEDRIDNEIFEIYKLSKQEINDIYNFFDIDSIQLNDSIIKEQILSDVYREKSFKSLSLEFKTKMMNIIDCKLKYLDRNKGVRLYQIHDPSKICDEIYNYIKDSIYKEIYDKGYIYINQSKETLVPKINNFMQIIQVLREFHSNKKSLDLIKDALNSSAYTWNAYRKDKAKDKVNKTFVKYYDSKYYGLSEWSDEIHKKYFIDVIDEHTINKPNEKKAKDILRLFKELDIEDKEDYIDIIQEKIDKAFS